MGLGEVPELDPDEILGHTKPPFVCRSEGTHDLFSASLPVAASLERGIRHEMAKVGDVTDARRRSSSVVHAVRT